MLILNTTISASVVCKIYLNTSYVDIKRNKTKLTVMLDTFKYILC